MGTIEEPLKSTHPEPTASSRGVDRPRVLLIWPGSLFERGHNFGVPHLLALASAARKAADVHVDVVDLDFETAFHKLEISTLVKARYDLVGISCYSSFDYLKTMAIAHTLRRRRPEAWFVVGGYHASARPGDFTGADSPFDFVALGDGEGTMAALVKALEAGRKPSARVLRATPAEPDIGAYDFALLERYRPFARKVASQAEISLSRGCPFGCTFCMERAKGENAWRVLEPEAAVEQLQRLDGFLDLSTWTVFVSDALFGLKTSWRRAFLEHLARRPVRARKIWVLARQDLLEREDLALMARANVAPGFGLESGDPEMVSRIQKGGSAEAYLEHMQRVAAWAKELDVPWGANVIVGHPGETEASMRKTARYLKELFLATEGTTGFVSVDPYRLYPGSKIDVELAEWKRTTGMVAHRYPWWYDGDQGFLAEWVDPSRDLDFRTCHRLRQELFAPIAHSIRDCFCYQGQARDYFLRAIDSQIQQSAPSTVVRTLGLWHLWSGLVDETSEVGETRETSEAGDICENTEASDLRETSEAHEGNAARSRLLADGELRRVAREARAETIRRRQHGVDRQGEPVEGQRAHGPARLIDPKSIYAQSLIEIPRERFVPWEALAQSCDDVALGLTQDGLSTLSAMHAYAQSFEALALGAGDRVVDLGGGTGYGAAVAAHAVGEAGHVTCIEMVDELVALARDNLRELPNVTLIQGDAHDVDLWRGEPKVTVGFDVGAIPDAWLEALPLGGRLVAPVGGMLTRYWKSGDGRVEVEQLGPVRYVGDRTDRPRGDRPR